MNDSVEMKLTDGGGVSSSILVHDRRTTGGTSAAFGFLLNQSKNFANFVLLSV